MTRRMQAVRAAARRVRGPLANAVRSIAERLDDAPGDEPAAGLDQRPPDAPPVDPPHEPAHDATEPSASRWAFERALDELGPQAMTVVDVGARWGAEHEWFRLRPLARLIGFDPDEKECEYLNGVSEPTDQRYVPLALGRTDGTCDLYVTREPGCSSVYPPSEQMLARYPSLVPIMTAVEVVAVPVTRLDSWAASAGEHRLDFVKVDTQGSELDILVGAGSLLDRCLGIQVEVEFAPLYDGQPLFADVDGFLRAQGFQLWRIENLAHYTDHPSDRLSGRSTVWYEHVGVEHAAGDGRLVWANAVYFRDREQLSARRDLLVLAVLLEAAGDLDGSASCLAAADHIDPNPA